MAEFNTDYYKGTDQYSDGDVEDRILEQVRAGKSSEDTDDRSFPVLYHLSPVRENILSWYPFRENARVLEIGAGPGAITGLLCSRCADVTSVELSHRRASINYERHKDCENLRIMKANGLILLIVFGIVSMFINLGAFEVVLCYAGIIIFLLFTAYDTRKISALYTAYSRDPEMLAKSSVISALQLYLDFVNLFLYILRLMNSRRN